MFRYDSNQPWILPPPLDAIPPSAPARPLTSAPFTEYCDAAPSIIPDLDVTVDLRKGGLLHSRLPIPPIKDGQSSNMAEEIARLKELLVYHFKANRTGFSVLISFFRPLSLISYCIDEIHRIRRALLIRQSQLLSSSTMHVPSIRMTDNEDDTLQLGIGLNNGRPSPKSPTAPKFCDFLSLSSFCMLNCASYPLITILLHVF